MLSKFAQSDAKLVVHFGKMRMKLDSDFAFAKHLVNQALIQPSTYSAVYYDINP